MRKIFLFSFLVFLSGYAIAQPTVADTTKFRVFDRAGSWISTGSILKTYFQGVGSTSITTLGTITTGTWNASTIPILYGGTGQTTANAALNAFLPSQTSQSGKFLQTDGTNTSWVASSGSGTVTSVSVVTANGFAGTVATATTTPAITISTGITGLLKGNGTSVSAAVNSDLPVMTATVGGAVPTPPNNTTTFLRGDGTFATPAGGGSVATDAIWDAKGDLAVGTGADAASRLAVGTDGGQIYADASTSTGLRWLPSVISPAQITSDQDDYAPTGWAKCQVLRISGDNGFRAITSFSATFAGDRKTIVNVGTHPLYIPGDHPDGTAANRVTGLFSDFFLGPGKAIDIMYDGTLSRWIILGQSCPKKDLKSVEYQYSGSSVTAGDISQMALLAISTGTIGGGSPSSTVPTYVNLGTASSASAGYIVYFAKTSSQFGQLGSSHISASAVVSIPALSDGTNTFSAGLQITNSVTSTTFSVNNSIGIRYTDGVNGGRWEGYTRSTTETTVDSGVTVASATIYVLSVEIDVAKSEARFYVDGVMVGVSQATFPTSQGAGCRALILKSAGTSARNFYVHSLYGSAVYP